MLNFRDQGAAHTKGLMKPRIERAIGVIYRPESELASHYFEAILPRQFDEYIWFDETHAVTPFKTHEVEGFAGHISIRRVIRLSSVISERPTL